MRLEEQLEELAKLGLHLAPGIGAEDFLGQLNREAFEDPPFDVLLTALGAPIKEPFEEPACSRAWSFDTECIYDTGDYVSIVKNLLRVAGKPEDYLASLEDRVDFESGEAWLKYRLPNGEIQQWDIEINDDWADTMVVNYVMTDLEEEGRHFYSKPNGQAMTLYYFDDDTAERLDDLAPRFIERAVPDEEEYDD